MKTGKNKLVLAVALITVFFKLVFFQHEPFFNFILLLVAFVVYTLLAGNLQLNNILNNRYPWMDDPQKRVILQAFFSTVFTSMVLFVVMGIMHYIRFHDFMIFDRKMQEVFIPALILSLAVLAVITGGQFFKALQQSMVDVEKYKAESANAQLQNLKSQLNPHFLFNNLSVLTLLVQTDQGRAVNFINELSKVYRYVLDNKNAELVTLQQEMAFLQHYIYLLKIRFGNSLIFTIDIGEKLQNAWLPPMCLQMLAENTYQHNEASQANPLQVLIYTSNNHLVVQNPIQPRSDIAASSKTGLKNIQTRYSYFTNEKIVVSSDGGFFKIMLPLIVRK